MGGGLQSALGEAGCRDFTHEVEDHPSWVTGSSHDGTDVPGLRLWNGSAVRLRWPGFSPVPIFCCIVHGDAVFPDPELHSGTGRGVRIPWSARPGRGRSSRPDSHCARRASEAHNLPTLAVVQPRFVASTLRRGLPRCSTASLSTRATASTRCCSGTASPITPYPTQPGPARVGGPVAHDYRDCYSENIAEGLISELSM